MSNIDKQALREVAEKATKGPWTLFSDIDTKTFSIHTPRDKRCENVIKWGGFDCQPNAEANAEFIAAFNPKVALALLDELEHYKSREERVTKLVLDNSTSWDALYKKLEAAERRVAELESNEVREVGNQFLVVRHPGKTPVIKHCTGDLEEFLRKLIEQDPLVTIDIITHRYYGIGGQWVQDAVEYLHMMSDAGIRIKGE
ncbi:ead/Ea22-like family protein [Salmonella enterica subsp. enterica serovar Lexington]|nr:ead/Ea22-like family protein [Salmonella enterica subsp. enterica serovar Lexington]EED3219541.1 ead/Ea22-like family protein [Salmonella enterica subsp. enterica]HAK8509998.1 ead/Ea22-like family protein [Salmonella enterica]EBH8853991.1 ead/Ea22-like family protein [Salmonella enterica subsp. enterica serovar Lexington]EDV2903713.1 ead/Ea22-like family protein [Salmonella enterica subsp. enterica serovar Lexington]